MQKFFLFFLIFFTSCSFLDADKNNIENFKKNAFKANIFLIGEGRGKNETEAEFAAKASLSRIFKSDLVSNLKLSRKATEKDKKLQSYQKDIDSQINISSNVRLENVQTKIIYDKKRANFYAISALDKLTAKKRWEDKIDKINGQIAQIVYNFEEKEKNAFEKIKLLKQIIKLNIQREFLINKLSVIGVSYTNLSDFEDVDNYNLQTFLDDDKIEYVFAEIEQIKKSLIFFVEVKDDISNNTFKNCVNQHLLESNFKIVDTKDKATFFINIIVDEKKLDLKRKDVQFVKLNIVFKIFDLSGKTVFTQAISQRSGHFDYEQAKIIAAKKIQENISKIITQF